MSAPQTATPTVVFTTSADPLLHGPLAVIRSLGRWGIPTYVVHPGGRLPVDSSRYLTGRFGLQAPGRDARRLVDRLVDVARTLGTRPVLVPVDDEAALIVDDNDARLTEHFLFPHRPAGLASRLASKRELTRTCRGLGVPAPHAWFPETREEARACLRDLPVVVKAVDPVLLRRAPGARSVTLAFDVEQGLAAYDLLAAGGPGNVMVQEYVPGDAATIWMFNGYFDSRSRCRFGGTGVKLRQCPPGTGPTSLGEARGNDEVRRTAERLLGSVGYTGIVDLGFRYDARDGAMKLLDVNPRIGGTFRLFAGRSGLDVVRSLYLDLTGQEVPDDAVPEGRHWQDEPHDVLAQAIYRRRGESSWPSWLTSLRGLDERAWYAADDRRPVAALWRHVATRSGRGVSAVMATSSGAAPSPTRVDTTLARADGSMVTK
jgi:D-aspartate ligase